MSISRLVRNPSFRKTGRGGHQPCVLEQEQRYERGENEPVGAHGRAEQCPNEGQRRSVRLTTTVVTRKSVSELRCQYLAKGPQTIATSTCPTLIKRGVSLEKVEALESWRQSNLFDRREQAVLEYAEAMTRSDRQVEDAQVESLRSYFGDDGIVELTGLIAFQNMSSKFNSALGVPAQGFCKVPSAETFEPPRV